MKITKENFEEICMLYADHELSAEQRAAVDAFVEANPELRADLELFVSLTLDKDASVQLDDKAFLFRSEDEITESIRENMLLHLDGELQGPEKDALEARMQQHEKMRQEWDILQKTRLDAAEQYSFPHRALLYRSAQTQGRVIGFRWVRYAAAAAILLTLGLFWLNRGDIDPDTNAGTNAGYLAQTDINNDTSQLGIPETSNRSSLEPFANPEGGNQTEPATEVRTAGKATESTSSPSLRPADLARENKVPERTLPDAQPSIARVDAAPERVIDSRETEVANLPGPAPVNHPAAVDLSDKAIGDPSFKADYATQALASDQSNPAFIEVDNPEENRGRKGLRGLVRKANRIYHKVTNPDLDKPLAKATNIQIGVGR